MSCRSLLMHLQILWQKNLQTCCNLLPTFHDSWWQRFVGELPTGPQVSPSCVETSTFETSLSIIDLHHNMEWILPIQLFHYPLWLCMLYYMQTFSPISHLMYLIMKLMMIYMEICKEVQCRRRSRGWSSLRNCAKIQLPPYPDHCMPIKLIL